jgi:hypothetical protein
VSGLLGRLLSRGPSPGEAVDGTVASSDLSPLGLADEGDRLVDGEGIGTVVVEASPGSPTVIRPRGAPVVLTPPAEPPPGKRREREGERRSPEPKKPDLPPGLLDW